MCRGVALENVRNVEDQIIYFRTREGKIDTLWDGNPTKNGVTEEDVIRWGDAKADGVVNGNRRYGSGME